MFSRLIGAAAFIAVTASASAAYAQTPTHQQALDAAAANKITKPMEFWTAPKAGMAGIEGFGADGKWYEVVLDGTGKIIRSGETSIAEPVVKMKDAAEAATKAGIAKLAGVWENGGNWFVRGWDAAEKEVVLMVNGASGEVKKFTN